MSVAHCCHLLIIDASESRLLVSQRGGCRRIPYALQDDASPAFDRVTRFAARANLRVQVIHEAPLATDDGGYSHSYAFAIAPDVATAPAEAFEWQPLDDALAKNVAPSSSPLFDAQANALADLRQRLVAPSAPFDNPAGIRELDDWVARRCAQAGLTAALSEPHRAERDHRVARYPTAGGDVYFKGGRQSDIDEGLLTTLLNRLTPDNFARPLAFDHERQWFLMSGVPGTSLAASAYDTQLVDRFVRTLSAIQKRASVDAAVASHLCRNTCTSATMRTAKEDLLSLATEAGADELGLKRTGLWRDLDAAVEAPLQAFESLALPASWIHPDLWSANVLIAPERVGIIDLEDSMWGPAPLSLWRFMGDICRGRKEAPQLWQAATRAACETWRPLIPGADLREALSLLPVVGRLLTFHMLETRRQRRRRPAGDTSRPAAPAIAALSVVRGLLAHLAAARRPLSSPNVRDAAVHGQIRHAIVAERSSSIRPAARRAPVQLTDVLAPMSLEDFVTRFVGTEFLLARGATGRFRSLLSWEELNEALRHLRCSGRRIRIVQNGDRLRHPAYLARPESESGSYTKAREVTALLAGGATLVVDQVDELFPAVQALAESCEDIFHTHIGVNLYAGWRADRGFDFHWDDHDTLILQVAGRKHWRVHRPAVEHPMRGDRLADSRQPDDAPIWEGHLTDGDVLYMPKGWWHVAQPVDEPSLHLTVGIGHGTGFDALQWMLDQLHCEVDLRQPVSHLATEDTRREMARVIRDRVSAALTDDLIERYIRHRDRGVIARPRYTLPDILPATQQSFAAHDHLRLASDRRLYFSALPDGTLEFVANGGTWTCAPTLQPALESLSLTRPQTFAALNATVPGEARIELYALMMGLISSGAVWVDHVKPSDHPPDTGTRTQFATAAQES